jgi:DNA polymerase
MLGKQSFLGGQYQMGGNKAYGTWTKNYGLVVTPEEVENAIATFRTRCGKIKESWSWIDRAAKDAVRYPGQWFSAKRLRFIVQTVSGIPYLVMKLPSGRGIPYRVMKLPSGRGIVYPYPEIKRVYKAAFEDTVDELSFWGQITGKSFWGRIPTYGGKLLENACQGIAADVMAYGLVRATAEGFEPEMLVHDQMLARDPLSRGDELLKQCMVQMPPWADGLPLAVKGGLEEFYS